MRATAGDPDPRPTIADALILVAATAIGLGIVVPFAPQIARDLAGAASWTRMVRVGLDAAWPCVAAWTVSVLAILLRRDRRVLAMAGRPEGAACLLPTVILTMGFLPFLGFAAARGFRIPETPASVLFGLCTEPNPAGSSGLAVAAAWMLIRLKGRWRPAAGWAGRAGRWIGWAWIGRLGVLAVLFAVDLVEMLRSPPPSF